MTTPEGPGGPEHGPILRQPASQAEISALITRAGEFFSQAHLAAGTIQVGEEPPQSRVIFTHRDLRKGFPLLSQWQSGQIEYSPPIFHEIGDIDANRIDDFEFEYNDLVMPPSLTAIFSSQQLGQNKRPTRSFTSRTLTLFPTTPSQPAHVWDETKLIDTEVFREVAKLQMDPEEMRRLLKETWREAIADMEAEDAMQAELLGASSITKGELLDLGRLMKSIVTPRRVKPPEGRERYDDDL